MNAHQETSVLVRDREQLLRLARVDDWDAMTMLAAVSSDPRSFRELGLAWLRYRGDQPLESLPWQTCGAQTPGGEWLLIDLACQRLVSNSADLIPEEPGAFQRTEGKWTPDIPLIWCNFPPWWQCSVTSTLTDALPLLPDLIEPVDFRGVLYGRTMAQGLADHMWAVAENETLPGEHPRRDDMPWEPSPTEQQERILSRWHDLTIRVHAAWLMTPRDELDGQPPREFLHRGREWVEQEVENRSMEWSKFKRPPRALDRESHAYRHGPMGRDEVVVYFDLCREVIHFGWKLFCQQRIDREQLSHDLHAHAQRWLESGSIDGEATTPAEIIECSRRHMPRLADGTHLDCDCPLCRMLIDDADMFYPTFTGFDGHHLELDDEFAFSLCATREEWDAEQERFRQYEQALASTEEVEPDTGDEEYDSVSTVWKSSFVAEGTDGWPGVSILTLAFRMTELISDLKMAKAAVDQVTTLNGAFDAVRSAGQDLSKRKHAAEEMKAELERQIVDHPALTSKIADLQSQLDEWLRQPADNDVPF